jgi:hypothetical protein
MTKKIVRPVPSKWGLVRMDRTAVMYQELQKKEEKITPRPLWKRDYAK